ncbi:parvalbumin beta-like [Ranitomeya imitator]|uniref:parvalbumin beta-like n=1 Tax=Ranitomeya imitator TaxID=111125 RepID=UPI0037E810C9
MSMSDIFSAEDINKAFAPIDAGDFFKPRIFFRDLRVNEKSAAQVKKVFDLLDLENGGYIEEVDLQLFLKKFKHNARTLTTAETADFMKAGDPNNTGKISLDGFMAMVKAS